MASGYEERRQPLADSPPLRNCTRREHEKRNPVPGAGIEEEVTDDLRVRMGAPGLLELDGAPLEEEDRSLEGVPEPRAAGQEPTLPDPRAEVLPELIEVGFPLDADLVGGVPQDVVSGLQGARLRAELDRGFPGFAWGAGSVPDHEVARERQGLLLAAVHEDHLVMLEGHSRV